MLYEIFQAGPKKGQPKRLVDRVLRYLEASRDKVVEIPSKSSKFRTFRVHNYGTVGYMFIGKNGAVKVGESVTKSMTMTDYIHQDMKRWEAQHGLTE